MFFFPILVLVIVFVVWFQWNLRKHSKTYGNGIKEFLENEKAFNFIKKKSIDPDLFFVPEIEKLPIKDYPDTEEFSRIISKQKKVIDKAALTMIRLNKNMKNNDIKQKFGTANLEIITLYEENFNTYVRALNDWAEALNKRNEYADAENALKNAIDIGSEYSKTYILLADIYKAQSDESALGLLLDKIKNESAIKDNDVALKKVIEYINIR